MAPTALFADTIRSPPVVIGPTTKRATRPSTKIPQYLIDGSQGVKKEPFNPEKHLNYQPPSNIYTMKEIGLEGHGISPNAISEPFPLFTEEAIKQIRAEIFSEDVLENCQYSSSFSKNMIRGMGAARAPFIYDAWNSPEVLARVSQNAGVDLIPAFDFEIANINLSFDDGTSQGKSKDSVDELSAFAWHFDSFPFVCVTMLSDCTGMVGGETAMKTATGEIMKARGPTMGTAVVMQGRYIEHQALKAIGGRERISMVTAFRPKSPFVKDEIVLTGSRAISNLSQLYNDYTMYRLEVLEERIRARMKTERQRESAKRDFDIPTMRAFLLEQKMFLEATLGEIFEIDD